MFPSSTAGGSLQTSHFHPRDSTARRVQSKVNATSGLDNRCNGLTSTTTGTRPVSRR